MGEVADVWTKAANRNEVSSAVDVIERKLRENPAGFADGQVEDLYFLAESPLRVGFTINDASRTVTVVGLGVLRQR
ncbi:MAG TPA: hypothetical protein VNH11_10675 [Pirellulales bacterium]|nr:hypothetical protein [Pirellulales bacterium]